MPEPIWTLLAVVVGSVSTAMATIGVEWWKAKGDRKRRDRDQFLTILYALQDALTEALAATAEQVFNPVSDDPQYQAGLARVNIAYYRVNMQLLRVNDQPLSAYVHSMLYTLKNAYGASDQSLAMSHYEQALSERLMPFSYRIEDLMHGDPALRRPNPPLDWDAWSI